MQAIQPTVTPLRPVKNSPRVAPGSSRRQRSYPHKTLGAEAGVNLTQGRVYQSRSNFNRYFDPSLAKTVMQEQSNRSDPHQRPVILQEPEVPEAEESTPQP